MFLLLNKRIQQVFLQIKTPAILAGVFVILKLDVEQSDNTLIQDH